MMKTKKYESIKYVGPCPEIRVAGIGALKKDVDYIVSDAKRKGRDLTVTQEQARMLVTITGIVGTVLADAKEKPTKREEKKEVKNER